MGEWLFPRGTFYLLSSSRNDIKWSSIEYSFFFSSSSFSVSLTFDLDWYEFPRLR